MGKSVIVALTKKMLKWFRLTHKKKSNEKLYFTQKELAEMFDISQETVQQIVKANEVRAFYKGSKPYYDFDEFKECYFRERAIKGAVKGGIKGSWMDT